jgi:hypothetical protein
MIIKLYNRWKFMKKILIILGILAFINIVIITASKAFAYETGINISLINTNQIQF